MVYDPIGRTPTKASNPELLGRKYLMISFAPQVPLGKEVFVEK